MVRRGLLRGIEHRAARPPYRRPLASLSRSRPFSKCLVARFGMLSIDAGRQSFFFGSRPRRWQRLAVVRSLCGHARQHLYISASVWRFRARMGKRFKGKTCVYCAGASETGDHILAREFVPVAHRSQIPQVPACRRCNKDKSDLEHYLTAVLPFWRAPRRCCRQPAKRWSEAAQKESETAS